MGSDQDCQTHKFFLSGNDQQCRIAISVTLTYGLGIRARDLGGLGGGRAATGGMGGGHGRHGLLVVTLTLQSIFGDDFWGAGV